MKLMMVDPWGTHNLYLYTHGLSTGIASYVDLNLWTNYYYPQDKTDRYPVRRLFFKRSEKMKPGYMRNLVRFAEYHAGYLALIGELQKNSYDLVHIQWFLHYKSDIRFLTRIKQLCPKIVYTAHNVLPHRSGLTFYKDLKEIYNLVDIILVHGEGVKKEFAVKFPEYIHKVSIQRHGPFVDQDLSYDLSSIDSRVIAHLQRFKRVSLYFGNIFYNKGVDRLARIWLAGFTDKHEHLLIIAGKKSGRYPELDKIAPDIEACDNILYFDRFIENNLLHYLIDQSQIVLLPYRHASMSGVLFTAAEFKKPVLSTNTGAIHEYLIDGENSFLAENRDDQFAGTLQQISENISREELARMGSKLHQHIRENFSWAAIGRNLVDRVYDNNL